MEDQPQGVKESLVQPHNTNMTTENTEESTQNEVDSKTAKGKRRRKLTSNVWSCFNMLPVDQDNQTQRAECKHCGKIYNADPKYGTGNLSRHMKSCERRDTRDIGQLVVSQDKGIVALGSKRFDPNHFRELMTRAIILHDLPFSFVEYEGVRATYEYLYPGITLVTRNTAKADVVKMHALEKARIKSMLNNNSSRICLTSDLWTSIVTDGYITITAHFIDKDWVLQKRILNFCFIPPPHSGVAICSTMFELLCEWGIEKKLFALTLDNASSNNVTVDLLQKDLTAKNALPCNGKFFHIRCCAHILNLVVQEGLKDIDGVVLKIRESAKYVRGSQVRKKKFLECVNLVGLDSKRGLKQDVPTRWNSTFLMLDSAIYYRRAFFHLELIDRSYKSCPLPYEWEKAEKINEFLEQFYNVTCSFSGTEYPTSNLYFPSVYSCYFSLKTAKESDDSYLSSMGSLMIEKFEKYWKDFSIILTIAVVLDPRYKLNFVDYAYTKVYGVKGSPQFLEVKEHLHKLFSEYSTEKPSMSLSSKSDAPNTSRNSDFYSFENQEQAATQKSELEFYLDEPRLSINVDCDILDYWKGNQFRYPELAAMARDVLSIPISIVASEAAFSVGGRVLDQYRSSLKPDIVESLICTRDWLFGDMENTKSIRVAVDAIIDDVLNLDINDHTYSTSSQNQSSHDSVQQDSNVVMEVQLSICVSSFVLMSIDKSWTSLRNRNSDEYWNGLQWIFHGEVDEVFVEEVIEDNEDVDEMIDIIDDFILLENTEEADEVNGSRMGQYYDELFDDIEAELYPGCNWISSLNFLAKLMHLKFKGK
ncbi:zinc finger BED domain-containing protein RICESLEEPER 2-like [Humulus lupulus]|uniref:zinc finger BED domain-containing protein RICESLEEPER 2-like n=1 Tax=Humulus lupulus TaxID=3486 RepID=UPI002B403DA7|nr:zinc finger BED domain-containing protein RICESLEEPER 2-like [Humulus lupulus]